MTRSSNTRRNVRPPEKYRSEADDSSKTQESTAVRGKRERSEETAASPTRRTRRATDRYSPETDNNNARKSPKKSPKKKSSMVGKRVIDTSHKSPEGTSKRVSSRRKEAESELPQEELHKESKDSNQSKSAKEDTILTQNKESTSTENDKMSSQSKAVSVLEESTQAEVAAVPEESKQEMDSTEKPAASTTTPQVATASVASAVPPNTAPTAAPALPPPLQPPLDRTLSLLDNKNLYIQHIDLRRQVLSLSQVQQLTAAIKKAKFIKKIVLSDCRIGDEGLKLLLLPGVLSWCESLWLDGNDISEKGAEALAAWLESTQPAQLKRLFLPCNKLGPEGSQTLALSLEKALVHSRWSSIEMLDLGENQIGNDGAAAFGSALASLAYTTSYCRLKELHLYGNAIGNEGAQGLSKGLFLHELDLRYNDIAYPGAVALGEALRDKNATLKVLIMVGNPIGIHGASALYSKTIQVIFFPGDVAVY